MQPKAAWASHISFIFLLFTFIFLLFTFILFTKGSTFIFLYEVTIVNIGRGYILLRGHIYLSLRGHIYLRCRNYRYIYEASICCLVKESSTHASLIRSDNLSPRPRGKYP